MNKTLLAAIGLSLIASASWANQDDLAYCQEYADLRIEDERKAAVTADVVRTGANLLGALVGGRNTEYVVEGAIRNQGYSISSRVRMEQSRRQAYVRTCLSERKLATARNR